MKRIAIIGGGPSGLAAAICAAQTLRIKASQETLTEATLAQGVSQGTFAQEASQRTSQHANACSYFEDVSDFEVVILEAENRVGRSILATGNGRCNFSNAAACAAEYGKDASLVDKAFVLAGDYHNAPFIEDVLLALRERTHMQKSAKSKKDAQLHEDTQTQKVAQIQIPTKQQNPVLDFFAEQGLLWQEEAQGRLYPLANKASSVLDVLRAQAAALGVQERCECAVLAINAPYKPEEPFMLDIADGSHISAHAIIFASGARKCLLAHDVQGSLNFLSKTSANFSNTSSAHGTPKAYLACAFRGFSLPMCELRPMLCPLQTKSNLIAGLDGVRVRCTIELLREGKVVEKENGAPAKEAGEVLFRKYGVSGIAIFNLSRYVRTNDMLSLDFLPSIDRDELEKFAQGRAELLRCSHVLFDNESFLRGLVLPSLARVILTAANIQAHTPATHDTLLKTLQVLKDFKLQVQDVTNINSCQITRGGLSVEAFDAETLSAREQPGFFAAGEALDVDAQCGGFNLHWAWASGMLAGISAAEYVLGV